MRFALRLFKFCCGWLSQIVKLSICSALAVLLCSLVVSSGWNYALVDGEVKRCWCVHLPGYEEYTDWNHNNEIAIRRIFSMHAAYRLGPWIEPEWTKPPVDSVPLPESKPGE